MAIPHRSVLCGHNLLIFLVGAEVTSVGMNVASTGSGSTRSLRKKDSWLQSGTATKLIHSRFVIYLQCYFDTDLDPDPDPWICSLNYGSFWQWHSKGQKKLVFRLFRSVGTLTSVFKDT